ncbi:MAG: hypothetical protein HY600_03195 [Candidatus Omnitrophica bacterium]|nr:hypothetical protein [Candidatus Omnitrophota bacterium]
MTQRRGWVGTAVLAVGIAAAGLGAAARAGWAEEAAAPASPVDTAALNDAAPAAAPGAPAPAAPQAETVVLDEEVPAGATTTGAWVWESSAVSGTKSHGHPAADDLQQHAVTLAQPLVMPKNGELVTSVWLDPANPPKGVMLKLTLANGEETGVYWEGEEEVFNPGEEEEIWYYGLLPEFGVWTPLAVAAEDLGIEEGAIKTITFVTHGGRVLWDRTVAREITELSPGPSP